MAEAKKTKVLKKQDSDGKPIIIQQINIGQLERGNQTIQTWISNVKAAERELNPNRRLLLNTYLDADIDLLLESVKNKRIRALKNVPFEWPGLTNDKILENLKSPWFFEMLSLIGKGIFWGYGVLEFSLGDDGLIGACEEIPRQNINVQHRVITKDMWGNWETGWPYTLPPYKNYMMEIGKPKDLGLYAKIIPYILLKRNNLADFSRFCEMFGMPLRWYEYDPHDATARAEVTKQAEAQGSAAYVVVPKGTVVNFHNANQSGSQQAYTSFHKVLNDEITIGVLGQTLTTSNDGVGSNALGNVHMQVESELAMEDRIMTELLINFTLKKNILVPHGYPLEGIKGSFTLTEEIPMDKKLKMWLDMVAAGVPIAEEDFYDEFGVPMPGDRPVVIGPTTAAPEDPDDPEDEEEEGKKEDEKNPKLNAPSSVRMQVQNFYSASCKHRAQRFSVTLSYENDLNKIIDALIQKLWSREISAGDVDPDLWELVSKQLNAGVEEGFGMTLSKARGLQEGMLKALQQNVYVFSGFKNYQMLREASALLMDETGRMRTFSEFRTEILKLNQDYNVNFLQAEYNHAVGSSRMAGKWMDIVRDKETLPLLQYITAGDTRVRASHRPLNNIILPMDHPFWDTYMPPNDWNCRCNVKQLAVGEQTIIKQDQLPEIKDEFRFNPGKQKVIFPKSHPYYNVPDQDKGKADNNFGLKIPE